MSGGHVNGAVTVAIYIVEYKHWKRNLPIALIIIIAQLAGGFAACALRGLLVGWDQLAVLKPTDAGVYRPIWHVFLEEAMFTFLWVAVILHNKYKTIASSSDGVLHCFTWALTLFAIVCMASDQTGACLNPTIGITFMIMDYAATKSLVDKLIHLLIAYVFGPFLGGILAAIWTKFVGMVATPLKDDEKSNRFTVQNDEDDRLI